jgi:hypothetical protein
MKLGNGFCAHLEMCVAMATEVRELGAKAWGFLQRGFVSRSKPRTFASWNGARQLSTARGKKLEADRDRLIEVLRVEKLDDALKVHGGDPLRDDWRAFRPLASQREEIWSDWLAHLLQFGDDELLHDLFDLGAAPAIGSPEISREVVVPEDLADLEKGFSRADILLRWDGFGIHVEVKIGDPHLAKTWPAAAAIERFIGGSWRHFLLLLPDQRTDFDRVALGRSNAGVPAVLPMTWEDVANAFRRAMLRDPRTRGWLGLARIFTGAVEQILLNRPWLGTGLVSGVEQGGHQVKGWGSDES